MIDEKRRTKTGKFLSLILRHQSEVVGLTLEETVRVEVEKLVKACADYGKPVIFQIETAQMTEKGDEFFVSANRVGPVDKVAPEFLKVSGSES